MRPDGAAEVSEQDEIRICGVEVPLREVTRSLLHDIGRGVAAPSDPCGRSAGRASIRLG